MLKKFLIRIIELYQKYLSPDHSFWAKYKVPYCRFTPSCSDYAKEAIQKKGIIIGGIKTTLRVLRCMPWSKGGYDPVDKK